MTSACIDGIGVSVTDATSLDRLEKSLQRLVTLGCTHAELAVSQLIVTLAGRDNLARTEAVAALCARYELQYTLHAPIAVNFLEERHTALHRAVLSSALSFGHRINASLVVVHPGRTVPDLDRTDSERLLEIERDEIRRVADQAGRFGLRVGMENLNPDRRMMAGHFTSYALHPERLAQQIARIDHPAVTGVLDFGHAWLASAYLGFDYAHALSVFAPFVGHLHVTDNCGAPLTYPDASEDERIAYGMGDLHLPIGWGTVPYDAVLPSLHIRQSSVAILELASRHQEELEPALAATRQIVQRINDTT